MTHVKKIILLLALIFSVTGICSAETQKFDALATTYVEKNGAALTLIRLETSGEIFFAVTETSSQSVAFVKYEPKIYNFYLSREDYGYPPLMFVMIFPGEARGGADDKLGVWNENLHLIPIYALFDVRDEQIIFDAPKFYSGEGTLQPSHYHSDISDPVHTRLIEIFMRHMPELHRQVQARGVVLP